MRLSIDSITKGIVIDHIEAGNSMRIYHFLHLDKLESPVAIIKNVKSKKRGKKDIIKIEDVLDLDYDVLGFLDPNITVNIIDEGIIKEKKNLTLPSQVKNVIECINPRCVTSEERGLDQVFIQSNHDPNIYRCLYCEQEAPKKAKWKLF